MYNTSGRGYFTNFFENFVDFLRKFEFERILEVKMTENGDFNLHLRLFTPAEWV